MMAHVRYLDVIVMEFLTFWVLKNKVFGKKIKFSQMKLLYFDMGPTKIRPNFRK